MKQVKLNVELLTYTNNPLKTISMAAKLCYSKSDIKKLMEKIEKDEQEKFVKKLINMGHMSPIEHVSFTFAVEGISRACSHQLVRHRLASYSQQSQRYVSESDGFDYIIPPSIEALDNETQREYFYFMQEAQKIYMLISRKLNEKGIKGQSSNEDARFVLPNAAETKIIVTMNARELLHFFNVRCCNRAQWEIRAMADWMLKEAKLIIPIIFKNAGPNCLKGKCEEGDFSCGKIEEVRKNYLNN